jgi:signal transduction histidine kinase
MKKRILFVDDEPWVLNGLRRMLKEQAEAWDMNFTASAKQAAKLLAEADYDVLVLDIKMPDKNGLDLLSELKSDPRTRDTEVVVLTALNEHGLKRKALDLGATDLLNKPVHKEDLTARLNSVLRTKSYRDELKAHNAALEQQLIRSQKMEIIGALAAGVAHDLNNILTAINGYSEMATLNLPPGSPIREDLAQIKVAGARATRMVQQLLKLSRPTEALRTMCDLGAVIDEVLDLLRGSISKGITIQWEGPQCSRLVQADPTQMYQVIMNLCINALQAMKPGGVLTISLCECQPSADSESPGQESPCVKLQISDTGHGMDAATLDHIFEPGFTTKASEGGTGLGLFVVQRIIRTHGGRITVESKPGEGTTFCVYLPCEDDDKVAGKSD